MINKTNLEETAKKLGQPGLYATFKTYDGEEEEELIDKGYWGEINIMDDILDEEPLEGWEEDVDGIIWTLVNLHLSSSLFFIGFNISKD